MIVDRSIAPAFQIPDKIDFPSPIPRTLKNGVHLYFIPTPEIGAVRLEINADAPATLGAEEIKLASYFTLHMLMEGTKGKNSAVLDDFFDTYASEVEVIHTFEHQGLSLLTTKKHFQTVLPVFRELLTEAVFPEKELAKRKSQKILSLNILKEKTGNRASQLFRQELFGKDHFYGQITEEKDVEEIQKEDLIEFYSNQLWTNTEIFLTGNLSNSELEFIEEVLGDIPVHQVNKNLPHFENQSHPRLVEDREKALQSSIRLGCHLIPKNHPDYFGLWVFNVFLGGYFGSRLIKNIREDKGHTYGIYSSIGSLQAADYWVVMADVIKENREEVIEEIYKEIQKLQHEEIPTAELETVRNYLVGNLLSNFSSAFELISRFKSIHQSGLDFGFYKKQLEYIKTFEAEKIQEIGRKYLNKEKMVEIIVG
jgi:predicted Zn-dependent peptidase